MAKRKTKPPVEDEAQSERFMEIASELESAGDLDPERGERALDAAVRKAKLPKENKDDSR